VALMTYVKWTIRILLLLFVGAFLHYNLPHRDIVRIAGTYTERQDFSDLGFTRIFWRDTTGSDTAIVSRDVQFIQAVTPEGRPRVYRNQDTDWGWPPYFKFDTANVQTEAADLISTAENPRWAVVTHYGWRNELLSIFPNAISIRPVAGPDVRIIPWVNIIILTILAALVFWAWVIWRQFRERTIDPALQNASDKWDQIDELDDRARGRFWYWWDKTFRRR
jgi:hypothetical protein